MTDDELRTLVASYRPGPKVLRDMANIQVLGTVGPSASGKTTLMKALVAKSPKVKFILDETSRAPRPEEVNGVDFLFRTKDEILQDVKDGELVQVALGPNGDLYATRISSYPKEGIGVVALVPPAVREFHKLPIKSFQAAFIVPETYDKWQQWLAKQAKAGSWSREKLRSRLAEAKQSYEFALNNSNTRFILNDTIELAAKRLKQVAHGHIPDNESQARAAAEQNYQQLLKLLD